MARILLTRPSKRLRNEDNSFVAILRENNHEVIELPMIHMAYPSDMHELDNSLQKLAAKEYDHAILSSPTAIEFFHERAEQLGLVDAIQSAITFVTVGAVSAKKLEEFGYQLGLPLPSHGAGAAELLKSLRTFDLTGKRVLLLQSQMGIRIMERAFEMVGAIPERVILYETTGPSLHDAAKLLQYLEGSDGAIPDVIAFFSPSAVEFFVQTLSQMSVGLLHTLPALAAIGETTAFEMRIRAGKAPEIIARKANQESLANDIIVYLSSNAI
jgi:uroporphyrinogen-III synthase